MKTMTRRDFLKVAGIGGTALAAMGLAGCSNDGPNATQGGGDEVKNSSDVTIAGSDERRETAQQSAGYVADSVSVASGDPATFSPLRPAGGGKQSLNEIFDPLGDCDGPSGELYGVIAKDWHWEGNDFYVEIYDYVHDSDGNPYTANDVLFYYEQMKAEGLDVLKYIQYCEGAEVIDDTNIVFHFYENAVNVFQNIENMWRGACMCTQKAWEASADEMATTPVGTGPYKLVDYTSGLSATLERVNDYWQTDESLVGPQHQRNVKTIKYNFISDSAQVINALRIGEIDYAENIPSTVFDEFNDSDDYTVYGYWSEKMFQTYFNCLEGSPCSDINMRAAICYAMNSDDILAAVGGEPFARKLYDFTEPDIRFYNEDCVNWESYYTICDIDLAKEYLSKSSYAGETLKIYYYTAEYQDTEEAISLCIGAALEQIGVSYQLVPTSDIDNQNRPANANWDIMLLSVGANGSVVGLYNKWAPNQFEGGIGNWYDDKLQELYANFNTRDGATVENNIEIQKYLMEHFYCYGTVETALFDCWRNDLIADASVKTFRTWALPGSFVYVEK